MIPQILQMAFGKQSTAEPAVDGGANASKTGSYNGTGSSFTITGLQTTGNDNVIVAAFSVLTNTGLTAARTISSISGYATSWTLVQRRSFNFTGASTFTNTEEVWIGKIAASAAAADVTVTMSGTVSDHVAYNLKSFNNIDQTNTTDAVGGGQNGTTTPNSTSVNLTSPYAKGVELSIIQTPNAFTPAVTTSGFSEQDASGAKLATSRISQAWKLYSGAAPTSDPVSWGTQQQYNLETLVLRASGQLSQPTTAPSFVNGGSTGAGSNRCEHHKFCRSWAHARSLVHARDVGGHTECGCKLLRRANVADNGGRDMAGSQHDRAIRKHAIPRVWCVRELERRTDQCSIRKLRHLRRARHDCSGR
jgi:hypothetical protein